MKKYLAIISVLGVVGFAIMLLLGDSIKANRGPDMNVVARKAEVLRGGVVGRLQPSTSATWEGLGPLAAYEDPDTGDEYVVDGERNLIVRYSRARGYEKFGRGGAYMPSGQLLKIADDLADMAYEGGTVKGLRRTFEQRVIQEGPIEASEFVVEFREWEGDVETFNYIRIQLDASTGEVMSVEQDFEAIAVDLAPVIPVHGARMLAAEACGVPESCVTGAQLKVVRALEGQQHLVWFVTAKTGDEEFGAEGAAFIDAHSGEVLMGGMGGY